MFLIARCVAWIWIVLSYLYERVSALPPKSGKLTCLKTNRSLTWVGTYTLKTHCNFRHQKLTCHSVKSLRQFLHSYQSILILANHNNWCFQVKAAAIARSATAKQIASGVSMACCNCSTVSSTLFFPK